MVNGIDSFRDRFRDYTDCYTIIGGAACDILMTEAAYDFRATKDIDISWLQCYNDSNLINFILSIIPYFSGGMVANLLRFALHRSVRRF